MIYYKFSFNWKKNHVQYKRQNCLENVIIKGNVYLFIIKEKREENFHNLSRMFSILSLYIKKCDDYLSTLCCIPHKYVTSFSAFFPNHNFPTLKKFRDVSRKKHFVLSLSTWVILAHSHKIFIPMLITGKVTEMEDFATNEKARPKYENKFIFYEWFFRRVSKMTSLEEISNIPCLWDGTKYR